jgi:hypothetical protein
MEKQVEGLHESKTVVCPVAGLKAIVSPVASLKAVALTLEGLKVFCRGSLRTSGQHRFP